MPVPLGSPIFTAWSGVTAGQILPGALLYTYAGGTTTPQATYTDATLATPNTNPVVMNAAGQAQVWLPDNSNFKFALQDSLANPQWTIDKVVAPIPYTPFPSGFTPETNPIVFISATVFSVTGINKTTQYAPGVILQSTNSGGTVYSIVASSSFSTNTTVGVVSLSGANLDSGLSAMSYGPLPQNGPQPSFNGNASHVAVSGNTGTLVTATDEVLGSSTYPGTIVVDQLGEFSATTGRFTPKATGIYRVTASVGVSIAGVTFGTAGTQTKITKSGTPDTPAIFTHATPQGTAALITCGGGQYTYSITVGGYIDVRVNSTFSAGSPVPTWSFTIERIA
jgi:hypothetical protein